MSLQGPRAVGEGLRPEEPTPAGAASDSSSVRPLRKELEPEPAFRTGRVWFRFLPSPPADPVLLRVQGPQETRETPVGPGHPLELPPGTWTLTPLESSEWVARPSRIELAPGQEAAIVLNRRIHAEILVADEQGTPLEGVRVLWKRQSLPMDTEGAPGVHAFTGPEGIATLVVAAGAGRLEVEAAGHDPWSRSYPLGPPRKVEVRLFKERQVRLRIMDARRSIPLREVDVRCPSAQEAPRLRTDGAGTVRFPSSWFAARRTIQVEGYLPVRLPVRPPHGSLALWPARPLEITVLRPDSSPASQAEIWMEWTGDEEALDAAGPAPPALAPDEDGSCRTLTTAPPIQTRLLAWEGTLAATTIVDPADGPVRAILVLQPQPELTVALLDAQGHPVPGALVSGGGRSGTVKGREVEPGRYRLPMEPLLEHLAIEAGREHIALRRKKPTPGGAGPDLLLPVRLSPLFRVEILVLGTDGAPLAGQELRLRSYPDRSRLLQQAPRLEGQEGTAAPCWVVRERRYVHTKETLFTDPEGRLGPLDLPAGRYHLGVALPSGREGVFLHRGAPDSWVFAPGDPLQVVRLPLPVPVEVSAWDARSSTPVETVEIRLVEPTLAGFPRTQDRQAGPVWQGFVARGDLPWLRVGSPGYLDAAPSWSEAADGRRLGTAWLQPAAQVSVLLEGLPEAEPLELRAVVLDAPNAEGFQPVLWQEAKDVPSDGRICFELPVQQGDLMLYLEAEDGSGFPLRPSRFPLPVEEVLRVQVGRPGTAPQQGGAR